jgi:hypothetical protein
VHTPPELYGSREASSGAPDEEWLGKISRDWIVIGRDLKIYERPRELAAYRTARVKVFLLPGQARAADLVRLVKINLARICSIASTRSPGTWRLTEAGPQPYDVPESPAGRVS